MKIILFIFLITFSLNSYSQTSSNLTAKDYFNLAQTSPEDAHQFKIDNYTKAIELDPSFDAYYLLRGIEKGYLEDYRGAILDYTKAIEINPKEGFHYFNRGFLEILLNKKDSGCIDLSKAGELGFSDAYDYIKQYCN